MLIKKQINEIRKNGLFTLLKDAATSHDLSFAYVLAVASRETNMKHIAGDWDPKLKVYHGKGIIQIDDRYHSIAKGEYWRDHPAEMIDYGCLMLKDGISWAKALWPTFNIYQYEKISASAYNCGRARVPKAVTLGDSDLFTTGKNYGKDVLNRKGIITKILAETA